MVEYRHSAHAVYDIKYHVIWVTKYWFKVMRGRVAERARELIRQICRARDIVIVRGAISPDHIRMLLSVPPDLAPAKVVQFLKGAVVATAAAGIPGAEEAVLGAASVGAGVFLRDGGCGG